MLKKISKKVQLLIPVAALVAYVAMILACSSSSNDALIRSLPAGGDDNGADHAMYTDSLVNDYYDMAAL